MVRLCAHRSPLRGHRRSLHLPLPGWSHRGDLGDRGQLGPVGAARVALILFSCRRHRQADQPRAKSAGSERVPPRNTNGLCYRYARPCRTLSVEGLSMRRSLFWLVALLLLNGPLLAPSASHAAQGTPTAVASTGPQDVLLATTTSTADTGLLDALAPLFQETTGYTLKPIAVGSGAALELGKRGEADVVLAHSPQAEVDFMAGGFGEERRIVMFNDFVIVGPADDPAGIKGEPSAV